MNYPDVKKVEDLVAQFNQYSQLQHEYGAQGIQAIITRMEKAMDLALRTVQRLPMDQEFAARNPNGLNAIRALRPSGPRRLWDSFDSAEYRDRLEGAMLGRFAGCTFGAPVEGWGVEHMEQWAREIGDPFPPTDYWTRLPHPHHIRYGLSRNDAYTRDKMDAVPVDDDIVYTLLGLLIVEDYGPKFKTADVGKAWLKYLPLACTAECVARENLKKGVPALKAAEKGNPYVQWIGADIRADPWAYMAPGWTAQSSRPYPPLKPKPPRGKW